MAVYSHSKLSAFEQCPLRFKYRYIDKLPPEIEKSIEAHLGTCVHDALEWFYTKVLEGQTPSVDDLILKYSECWQENFSSGIAIVKQDLTAKDYLDKGVKFLLDYYFKNQPFDEGVLDLEKKITIKLNDEHSLIGYIDKLCFNPKTKEYEVHDYKTAGSLPDKDKIETDRQLAIYSIAVRELFGDDKEVKLIWHYLAFNQQISSRRTAEQLAQLKKDTLALIEKIEKATEYPACKSVLCGWCEYQETCKNAGN